MGNINYRKTITDYISVIDNETPITTTMIVEHVKNATELDPDLIRRAVNVNMARIEKQGLIRRVTRGVYCKQIMTPFGECSAGNEIIFCNLLTHDGDRTIGYESGASIFNRIGLTSQIPARMCITSNAYNRLLPDDVDIEIRKPVTEVTTENCRYLQLLDVIRELDIYPVDVLSPDDVIRDVVQKFGLDIFKLFLYCRQYYDDRMLGKTVDVILGSVDL